MNRSARLPSVQWPHGKRFAFTVFDDPDGQTLRHGRIVYDFLADLGFRTTKGVWPLSGPRPSDDGQTCDEPAYRDWVQCLRHRGFEIGFHNATFDTSDREQTARGLERFASLFGGYPRAMANHYACRESIYWRADRLTGLRRWTYQTLAPWRMSWAASGHVPGHPNFWGDLCKAHIQYVRNFVYSDVNTLRACPLMPYHDPLRPYVNYWFASSDGANVKRFTTRLSEENQDRLEAEGGACIMYAHFGHGFAENGKLNPRFRQLMERLHKRGGWFVPVSELLDHLLSQRTSPVITDEQRADLEWRWLLCKIVSGSS